MIIHCVFCNFLDSATTEQQNEVFEGLENLCDSMPGALSFEYGPNRDFEKKSQEFGGGFVIHFTDAEALEAYANHPTHKNLGGQLCDLCNGGGDGIIVFDIDA